MIFKLFRCRSLDAIMSGYHRTIADLEHFAKGKEQIAAETHAFADNLRDYAQGHEQEAKKARTIQENLTKLAA